MQPSTIIAAVALALAAIGLLGTAWLWTRLRALGLGLEGRAGPLLERMGTVGQRLEALEAGQAALEQSLGQAGLHPTMVPYAPLGLGGIRNCFVLTLLNREGTGVVLNYLAGTATRADLKQVRGWQSQGPAFTPEEEQAVAANQAWWTG